MGTSISHPSPNNNNWNPVKIGYKNKMVPLQRVIKEIWRASENQDKPLSSEITSEIIFKCHQVVEKSPNANEAIRRFNKELLVSKKNSIVAEFAKRAIPSAYLSDAAAKEWRNSFFSELTGYIVSRDASGYVGDKFRNKTVTDLSLFKTEIKNEVRQLVGKIQIEPKNISDWKKFVDHAINDTKSLDR